MKLFPILFLIFSGYTVLAQQDDYAGKINEHRKNYIKSHGAVKGADRKLLRFFPTDKSYLVQARVERIYEAPWFKMETSGKERKVYRTYAILEFRLNDTVCKLHVFQSQQLMGMKEYENHLFIPFTDLTTGEESYENGRYIDMTVDDLENGFYMLDFNKAYNPYCAYVSDVYNCPLPPEENDLNVAIRAGEMKFGKEH